MTNTEIRQAAQSIYRQLVSATYNDSYGQDDGTMNILTARMMKACDWAKENGEYDTLRYVCGNMFTKADPDTRYAANRVFSALFE